MSAQAITIFQTPPSKLYELPDRVKLVAWCSSSQVNEIGARCIRRLHPRPRRRDQHHPPIQPDWTPDFGWL